MKRRNFIKKASATGLGLVAVSSSIISCDKKLGKKEMLVATLNPIRPLVIATWKTDLAVETAAKVLEKGGQQ